MAQLAPTTGSLGPLRPLVAIVGVEAVGVTVTLVAGLVAGLRAGDDIGFVLSGAIVYALFLVGLVLIGGGLMRRSKLARGPFVVAQLFALVAAWGFWQSPNPVLGVVLAVLALLGLVLALRPATLAHLR